MDLYLFPEIRDSPQIETLTEQGGAPPNRFNGFDRSASLYVQDRVSNQLVSGRAPPSTSDLDECHRYRNELRHHLAGAHAPAPPDGRHSFHDVVTTSQSSSPLQNRPLLIGGNIAVRIDGERYRNGLSKFENCLIGIMVLFKGNPPVHTNSLKSKLSASWSLSNLSWKLIPLGRGFFCLDLKNPTAKSKVFARGILSLNPGMFYISKWIPNFNPNTQKITNTQVWIKIHGLSMDYWDENFLLDIGMGVGTSLRIDRVTAERELGHFARVLVDVDVSRDLPDRILVQLEDLEFFVHIEYENLLDFCKLCNGIGYDIRDCRRAPSTTPVGHHSATGRADANPVDAPRPHISSDSGAANAETNAAAGALSNGEGPVVPRLPDRPARGAKNMSDDANITTVPIHAVESDTRVKINFLRASTDGNSCFCTGN